MDSFSALVFLQVLIDSVVSCASTGHEDRTVT